MSEILFVESEDEILKEFISFKEKESEITNTLSVLKRKIISDVLHSNPGNIYIPSVNKTIAYRRYTKKVFDSSTFSKEHPNIYALFLRESESSSLLVLEGKPTRSRQQ